ncbi:MAG: restriction endonuclease subunit S [Opitutaceae bacterium]|nr:restriction endonuclease subunit S [Opitutaceae bacterium]
MANDCFVADIAAPIKNALVGGPFGSDLVSKDYVESGVPVIRGTNMGYGRWVGGDFAHVTEEKADSLTANCAKPGDIVFTQRGTLGQVALVPNQGAPRYLISQSQMKLTVDQSKADPLFLYYVFTSPEQQEYIRQHAIQTGVPHTNLGILRRTPLTLPPLPEQKAIARILGTLDDKIELNRRMNATLEAMARALFQSWLVDFDPVHAKAAGRPPSGMASPTAAVFPSSLQSSNLGEIPEGWDRISLYDTARFINGAAFRNEDFSPDGDGLPVIKIVELKSGLSSQTKWSRRSAGEDQIIDTGDLLYSWSGSPDTSLDAFLWTEGRGLLNQHIFKVITPTITRKRYVYYLLKYLRPVLVGIAKNKQTTGLGHVTISDMKRLMVCEPPHDVLQAFDRIVGPLFDRSFSNTLESQKLAQIRDCLLPKLLSEELSARAVENISV